MANKLYGWSKVAGVRFTCTDKLFLSVAGRRGEWFWQINLRHSPDSIVEGRCKTASAAMQAAIEVAPLVAI